MPSRAVSALIRWTTSRPVRDRGAHHDAQGLARLDAHRVGVAGDRERVGGGRQRLRHRANSSIDEIEHLIEFDCRGIYSGPRAPTPGPHPRAPVERPAGAVQPGRPRLVRGLVRGPDTRAVRRLGGDLGRPSHADPCPDGQRQDARGLPLVHRPADPARERATRSEGARRARPLRLAAQGAHLRRRAQPPRAAGRDRARRQPARRARRAGRDRIADRRHPGRGAPADGAPAAGHPDHHSRVALPAPDEPGAGEPADGRARHRRRGPRDRRHASAAPTWRCRWSGWSS